MANAPHFSVANAGPEHVAPLRTLCLKDGGHFEAIPEPGGNFTAVCTLPGPGAAATANVIAMAAAPVSRASTNPNKLDVDLAHLHPMVRRKVKDLQKKLDDENIPMKLFEGFRSPNRQAYLYAKGRTTPGPRVTGADAWESYHQYGIAADFVRFEGGNWNWNTNTAQQRADWDRYHEIALGLGLEPLSWEKPHVQLMGHSLNRLMHGDYPDGGDDSWADNLAAAIAGWPDAGAPPPPESTTRPAISTIAHGTAPASGAGMNWHSRFGGDAWAYDAKGIYTRNHLGQVKQWRTPGAPITVREVLTRHGDAIDAASSKYDVPKALIVMTVATETGRYRSDGFTGPKTFRWEQGFTVRATGNAAYDSIEKGDYSAGPMQVMSDTARWMNNTHDLGYNNASDFKFYKNRPSTDPTNLGLYKSQTAIDVGTAYIRHNMSKTGDNPLLVAAAYNAGGLYPTSENHWRIRSSGNHLDRAAEWYGDATHVLNGH